MRWSLPWATAVVGLGEASVGVVGVGDGGAVVAAAISVGVGANVGEALAGGDSVTAGIVVATAIRSARDTSASRRA